MPACPEPHGCQRRLDSSRHEEEPMPSRVKGLLRRAETHRFGRTWFRTSVREHRERLRVFWAKGHFHHSGPGVALQRLGLKCDRHVWLQLRGLAKCHPGTANAEAWLRGLCRMGLDLGRPPTGVFARRMPEGLGLTSRRRFHIEWREDFGVPGLHLVDCHRCRRGVRLHLHRSHQLHGRQTRGQEEVRRDGKAETSPAPEEAGPVVVPRFDFLLPVGCLLGG
mmetsp:Transcript_478/g.1121  ORF Transcript_478/g.1121 Transcript_478/m.1121 type:complete len:222 (+) Transcript_478:690-1355(+)